ncbi:phosphatase PAP2 family protein [Nonomuraea sp. SYSU D8015]|uniref:phosphatase PAP2 family protein n=1 Tax=Nonomuraea sp. SYSU D8015 TaxID=2593644 RepID=UPI001CB6E544|nr:phosphatase PAP2 family protein [Nonomuraea sp. SYSU D8015]
MNHQNIMDRRGFLARAATASAGLIAGPAVLSWLPASPASAAASAVLPFADHYKTNATANLTPETNAAVAILSDMARVWKTGTAWDDGTPLMPDVLRANVGYCVRVTTTRTDAQAKTAFIFDRQHQSYSIIDGLGPLAALYKTGAKAVTSITSAPDGTPPTTISDAVPPGAPAGSAIGAGSPDSELGKVVQLVNTLRGAHSSSNPSKFAFQYPRPWRLTNDSRVVDTGKKDDLGYPVYDSDVVVAPQLLRQRATNPAEDGGYVSGHANAVFLAALALAYAVPERFQELLTRAFEVGHSRIVAGMHSPVDVVGGRILATALAAAILNDPANAELKAAARSQAAAYLQAKTGITADTLHAHAHSAGPAADPYADREANRRYVTPRLTYILPRRGRYVAMEVPKGAEALLETRFPYLGAAGRREVLRTTALPSGYVILDGPEPWGRLNLFAAADGYGAFDGDVTVTMNASDGGFSAADTWRNDIGGRGGLTKTGTGALTLTGDNRYTGGTSVEAGTLVAGSPDALGRGPVTVRGGRLAVTAAGVRVRDGYRQSSGGVLEVTLSADWAIPLTVAGEVVLDQGSVLQIKLDGAPRPGKVVQVIRGGRLQGRFGTVTVDAAGIEAVPLYTAHGLSVRLVAR